MEFIKFPKIPRLSRECAITEKIDGTNASIYIVAALNTMIEDEVLAMRDGLIMIAGSRTRWISPKNDNHGFAKWVQENSDELWKLGKGRHFGEWWGQGIGRAYGLKEKRFSLFNTSRWIDPKSPFATSRTWGKNEELCPECCYVVPILYQGIFNTDEVETCLDCLKREGSQAAPNFMRPEGIVVYHVAGNVMFKKTLDKNDESKG